MSSVSQIVVSDTSLVFFVLLLQTQLAQAIAGEAQGAFVCVGPSDILSKFVGESEASVRSLFKYGAYRAAI
jgi:ATP-dependent 26S proteasome regulatory subunit